MSSQKRKSFKEILKVIDRLDLVVSKGLGKLGGHIATAPVQYIAFSLLFATICATGIQQLDYESNLEYLFVPLGARYFSDRRIVEEWFPMNHSRYNRGADIDLPMMCDLSVLPKDGDEIMKPEIWKEALNLVQAISKIQVKHENDLYNWRKLCLKFEGKCVENNFLQLHDIIGTTNLTFPVMDDPRYNTYYPLVAHLGGVVQDNGVIKSAKAMKITFFLDNSNKRNKAAGEIWAQVAKIYSTSLQYKHIQVAAITDKSIESELSFIIDSCISQVPLTCFLVLAFTVYNCLSTDWVRSKPLLGAIGLFIAIVSAISSFGIVIYFGFKWQAINLVAVFLLIGIGLDDTFVMLSSWWRSESTCERDVQTRIALTFEDSAVSITITSVTSIISFLIGAVIPGFPCVQIFCIYAGMGMVFLYFYTLTIFGGFLTLAGHLEHANRHSLLFIKVKSKTLAEDSSVGWLYSVAMQGGLNKSDISNKRDNKEGKMMVFFRDVVAPFISNPWTKLCIILLFLAYAAASVYGILNLKEGLERKKLVGDYSYTVKFFEAEDDFFRNNPYRFQVIIYEPLDYSNKTVQTQIRQLIHELEDSKYISSNPAFRQSWFHRFTDTVERNFLFFDVSTPQAFMGTLHKYLEEARDTPLYDDVVFSEDRQTILASRIFIQSDRINDAMDDVEMLATVRSIVDSAPFKASIYNPYFGFFDQFSLVLSTTIECVVSCCVCMSIITLLFIPNKICVIWVTFTILSVELGVVGFMGIIGINLDCISMIVLIMGIGFSVDFSAHISYHYLSAEKGMDSNHRLAHCLHALGPPIIRGGPSTLLGVVGLLLQPSYITHTFAKLIFLIIILGMVHGLFLLPVLLSLFGGFGNHKHDAMKPNPAGLTSPNFQSQNSEADRCKPEDTKTPAGNQIKLDPNKTTPVVADSLPYYKFAHIKRISVKSKSPSEGVVVKSTKKSKKERSVKMKPVVLDDLESSGASSSTCSDMLREEEDKKMCPPHQLPFQNVNLEED